jgi:hypothetical protein
LRIAGWTLLQWFEFGLDARGRRLNKLESLNFDLDPRALAAALIPVVKSLNVMKLRKRNQDAF